MVVAGCFYFAQPHRTKDGDRLLAQLIKEANANKRFNNTAAPDLVSPDLVSNVALFGSAALVASGLAGFHHYFTPPTSSSSSSSSNSSGCSSGSSCGSSCGSGCGGGCGGCGA
ncbi:MAG: hypothetical protein HC805_02395 [Alkalinema sp. RL_2_19]|nr:hypothetical protein [Alkalinema sp. RL_2_19]